MNGMWKRIPLHHKILAALVLGAVFGAVFNVSKYELNVTTATDGSMTTTLVSHWDRVEFLEGDSVLASFGAEDQLRILQFFHRAMKKNLSSLSLRVTSGEQGSARARLLDHISNVEKVETIAVEIKPIGTIFIRLLMFISIPLVLSSLVVGAASLGDIRRVGRLGGKTMVWYLITITVAITIGLTLVDVIQPGTRLSPDSREKLMVEFETDVRSQIAPPNLVDTVVNIVATNPMNALANGQMLQIVFFALMVGISLTMVSAEKAKPVVDFFDGFSDTMIKMVELIMKIAPYGVFALIAATVGEFGFDILQTLLWYVITLVLALSIHTFGFLGVVVRLVSKIPYKKFFQGLKDPMLVAFTTSSSGATLPVNMKATEDNLGVPKRITSFVLPLGATVNMDGTSMYQAVAAMFIAQVSHSNSRFC
jgi:Na+/H+-dicarboxylate symporter